ncbi:MAG TPA: Rieske (2Fe-2S) protein [Pirellulaceae bacterium]|nr:Rieske (2Fe-2S) protein [Pirellulaceae bacterium]
MLKSLKPTTTPQVSPTPAPPEPRRRGFLAGAAALIIGGLVGLIPMGAGLFVFLDPILKRKAKGDGKGQEDSRPYRRVASLDALPMDGTPVQVPVIADLTDAWNREPNQPIGAVYLRRTGKESVECFNAICPHAGCFVGYAGDRKCFQCPCHTSSFQLNGSRIMPSPSPRDMDALKVDDEKLKNDGEVWVQFVNYYPGHAEREAKP